MTSQPAPITADASSHIEAQVQALATALLARGHWLGTAESCTGGQIAGG